jgi:[protein-PII] uridylyltransferase
MSIKPKKSIHKLKFFNEQRFANELVDGNAIEIFKNAINEAESNFEKRFNNDEKTGDLLEEKSLFIDMILKHAWNKFRWNKTVALLAVGGYGRGELHPQSDIDLMILISSGRINSHKENIEGFLAFLWDIQ